MFLLVSSELDEVLALSDRVLVMYEGAVVAELREKSGGSSMKRRSVFRWEGSLMRKLLLFAQPLALGAPRACLGVMSPGLREKIRSTYLRS